MSEINPVAWTNEAQLGFVADTKWSGIPMAMWGERECYAQPDIALCRHDEAMAEIERLRALVSSSEAERYRVCGKLNLENHEMRTELDLRVGDLVMLRRSIEAGDPKSELLFRIDDMLRETRKALAATS